MTEVTEKTEKRKRPRSKRTYRYHKNAVCISVYSPTGSPISAETRQAIEDSVWEVASANRLLINIADV